MACVASLHSFGSFAAIIGSIIAKLKDESSPIHMTVEEETWFGKQKKNNFYSTMNSDNLNIIRTIRLY